jgi:hypothetical protein
LSEDTGAIFLDVDKDEDQDLIILSGGRATQPDFGSYDAGVVVLLGDGKANFMAMRPDQSGFVTRGEVRDIPILKQTNSNDLFYLVARNNDRLLTFDRNKKVK